MGVGFPKRLIRSSFGPKLRNNYPVENPETDVGDTTLNGAFWNLAGIGLVVPRAVLIASWNGSAFDYQHQAEAWNAENDQAHPVLTRTATGNYKYTSAATYLDEDGVAVADDLKGSRLSARRVITTMSTQRVDGYTWIDPAAPLVVELRLWDVNGAALADHPFLLEVW